MICNVHLMCPGCGDTLIHQGNRGPNESSSAFGQWVHDHVGRDMWWSDFDGVGYARRTHILRVFEHKAVGHALSPGQRTILPLIAMGVQSVAAARPDLIAPGSGVYQVNADPPYEQSTAAQIQGWPGLPVMPPVELDADGLTALCHVDPIPGAQP